MNYREYTDHLTNTCYQIYKSLGINHTQVKSVSSEVKKQVFEMTLDVAKYVKPLETTSNLKSDVSMVIHDIEFFSELIKQSGKE